MSDFILTSGCDNLRIGFIGAGKVGTALGMYFKSKGYELTGYYSRSLASAANAAAVTGTRYFLKDFELIANVDILFITTNDEQIKPVIDNIAARGILREGQIIVHTSGAAASDILKKAKTSGCFTYSMHPLQSFADAAKALEALPQTVFSIEGDPEKIGIIEEILKKTGNSFFRIKAEDKALYHAAACIFSNYLVTLMDQGLSYLESIGINSEEGFKAMLPLINGTIENIRMLGTGAALTGPVSRGDVNTIVNHMETINRELPDRLEFYRMMAVRTLELAKREKLKNSDKIHQLEILLK